MQVFSPADDRSSTLPDPKIFHTLVRLNDLLLRTLEDVPSADEPTHGQQSARSPVAIKEFGNEMLKVKNGLHEARRALIAMPDAERTLAQQEAEIKKLEAAINRKRRMLKTVGDMASVPVVAQREDEEMKG